MPFRLCERLVSTSHSIALRESRCMFLVVRTAHVLTLTVFYDHVNALIGLSRSVMAQ